MKIIRLEAQNVKRLSAVQITPEGNTVVIGGANGAGKTSVLDAIAYALGGKALIPDKPVRSGTRKARIVADLGDLVVTRTITAKGGGQLIVSNGNGARLPTPQAVLDKLVGTLTFDPLAFTRMSPKQQAETLRELVGLDFSEMEAQRAALFGERTDANREVKALSARLEAMPAHEDAPDEEVSVADLAEEMQAAQTTNASNDRAWDLEAAAVGALAERRAHVADLETQIEDLQARLADAKQGAVAAEEHLTACRQQVAELHDVDTGPIRERIRTAEDTNAKVRAHKARAGVAVELEAAQGQAGRLSGEIERIDEEKAETLEAAVFPVPGLTFDEDGVSYQGIPFDQCSSAEQLRISVAMGFAMNPKLKVMLIRDGSLLDADSLRLIAEMAGEHDGQIWLERVGTGKECQVILEDGHVKDAEPVEAESAAGG